MYSELVQIKGKIDFTKTYVMFYLINFIDMFQTSWDRVQQKTWKVVKCFKKKLVWNISQGNGLFGNR